MGLAGAGKILQNLIGPPTCNRRSAGWWEKKEIATRPGGEEFEDVSGWLRGHGGCASRN